MLVMSVMVLNAAQTSAHATEECMDKILKTMTHSLGPESSWEPPKSSLERALDCR